MPSWFTVFQHDFMSKELSPSALMALQKFAKIASIPKTTVWRVFVRGIGLVVTAKWEYGDPGAIPAAEVRMIGGIPVLVERQEGENGAE